MAPTLLPVASTATGAARTQGDRPAAAAHGAGQAVAVAIPHQAFVVGEGDSRHARGANGTATQAVHRAANGGTVPAGAADRRVADHRGVVQRQGRAVVDEGKAAESGAATAAGAASRAEIVKGAVRQAQRPTIEDHVPSLAITVHGPRDVEAACKNLLGGDRRGCTDSEDRTGCRRTHPLGAGGAFRGFLRQVIDLWDAVLTVQGLPAESTPPPRPVESGT